MTHPAEGSINSFLSSAGHGEKKRKDNFKKSTIPGRLGAKTWLVGKNVAGQYGRLLTCSESK